MVAGKILMIGSNALSPVEVHSGADTVNATTLLHSTVEFIARSMDHLTSRQRPAMKINAAMVGTFRQ